MIKQCAKCGEILEGFDPHICPSEDYLETDNPFYDGTDFAHPAWWRGNDRGVEAVCEIINEILDGNRTHGIFAYKKLNDLVQRLYNQNQD